MQLRHPEESFQQLSLADVDEKPIFTASIEVQSSRAPISQQMPSVRHHKEKPMIHDTRVIFEDDQSNESFQGFVKKCASPEQTQQSHSAFQPGVNNKELDIQKVLQATIRNTQIAASQQFNTSQKSVLVLRKDDIEHSSTFMMSSIGYQVAEDPSGVNLEQMREFMIDPGASKQIAYLAAKHLQLSQTECSLSTEPDGLIKLKLHHKDLMYIPREVLSDKHQFSEVQVLDVSNCSIVELEGKIFIELLYLRRLNASKNQIRQLSLRIGQLEFLEVLILDNNCLEMIPMEIGNLYRTLKVLKLANNKLKSITNRIRELTSLEVLHLQCNQIKALPENMELRKLQECMLNNNLLETFNLPLEKMPALWKLGIDWFSYLIPSGPKVIEKAGEDFVESEDGDKGKIALNRKIAQPQSALNISEDVSERINSKQTKTKAAQAPPSANKQPMTRVKTYSAAVYQRSQSGCRLPHKSIDFFKELVVLMILTKSRSLFTTHISNFQVLAQDVKDIPSEVRRVNNSSPRKLPQTFNMKSSPKSVGCGISFIPFAKHFIKLTTEVEGDSWINQVDDRGRTMLHQAALKGDPVIVKELLANGADKTIVDKYDFDAYGYAMREDHFKVGLQILTHKRQKLDFTRGSGTFGSHLHLAVAKLQPYHVDIMLSHGVDANLTEGIMRDTPCHVLVNQYNKNPMEARNILQQLVDSGANLNQLNKDGWSPIHCAIKKVSILALQGIMDVARQPDILIRPDLTLPGGPEDMTPLHLASQSHSFELLQMLFDQDTDLFAANANDQRAYSAVNNNLLMLKLIKKEEKRYVQQLFQKDGPRESTLTDKAILRAMLPPTNQEYKYTTFTETLQALTSQEDKDIVHTDEDVPFAFKSYGQPLQNTITSADYDFDEIRKRSNSESLSCMDVDEEKTHEQAKIVQLAGLSSTKKGVQLYKNKKREYNTVGKQINDFQVPGKAVKRKQIKLNFDQSKLDTLENRFSDRDTITYNAPPSLQWQVTSPSSMLRTSIKFQNSPKANEKTPKRPTQVFQSPFIKLNKHDLPPGSAVNQKFFGEISPQKLNEFVDGEENLLATLISPAETKEIKIPIAKLVAERVSSSLKSTFHDNDKPKLSESVHQKIMLLETPIQSSSKLIPFNEERKNSLLQSAIIELKEKRRSKLELRLHNSIATEESVRQVRASLEQSKQSSELPENKALKLEHKRSFEELKSSIEAYTNEQMDSEKGFLTSAKKRLAYLNQEAQQKPKWAEKVSPKSIAYEPPKPKGYFTQARHELENDVAENIKLNKTTLQKQQRQADIKSHQVSRQQIRDPGSRVMNNTVTLGIMVNSDATAGRKSALPQFNNASKNLFEMKKPNGTVRLKMAMSTKGSGKNTPEKSLECKLNPRVTTAAIAKKNHRLQQKHPGSHKPQRDTILIQKVSKAKLNHMPKQPERVNLFSQETMGCDVDSEADEAPVDSRKIWGNNKTAHGPKDPLEEESSKATILNDYSFLNVSSELQQTPLSKAQQSRNSLPVKTTISQASRMTTEGVSKDYQNEVIREYALISRKRPQKLESDNDVVNSPQVDERNTVVVKYPHNSALSEYKNVRHAQEGYYTKKTRTKTNEERVFGD